MKKVKNPLNFSYILKNLMERKVKFVIFIVNDQEITGSNKIQNEIRNFYESLFKKT